MSVRDTTRGTKPTQKMWGAFPSTALLPNVSTTDMRTPSLYPGDIAAVGIYLYRCVSATPGSAVWERIPVLADIPTPGAGDPIYHGEIYLPATETPVAVNGITTSYVKFDAFSTAGSTNGATSDAALDRITPGTGLGGDWLVEFDASIAGEIGRLYTFAFYVNGSKVRDFALSRRADTGELTNDGIVSVTGVMIEGIVGDQALEVWVKADAGDTTSIDVYSANLAITRLRET